MSSTALLLTLVFVLNCAAQVALTPLGEGMDFGGHFAYINFMSDRNRPPLPGEPAVPDWLDRLSATLPGPDFTDGTRYQAWAQLDANEREERFNQAVAAPRERGPYVQPNYEAQHPPLYYLLLSLPDRLLSGLRLDLRIYLLELATIAVAAAAVPAIYLTLRLYADDAREAGLAALGAVWFPNLLPFVGRLTNDALAFPLVAWSIYFMARPGRGFTQVVVAGVLLGLACLTKTYALALVPAYLIVSWIMRGQSGGICLRPRLGVTAAVCTGLVVGPLLVFNDLVSGQLLLLTEIRSSADAPLLDRVLAIRSISPIWFVRGVVQYFWWSGYWSFVVRWFLYLPLLLVPAVLVWSVTGPLRFVEALKRVWLHLLIVVSFVIALLLHAALLRPTFGGGNEGWYADVLLGSVATVGLVLLRTRLNADRLRLALAVGVVILVGWNLLARMVMLLFWSGQDGPGAVLPNGVGGALSAATVAVPWTVAYDARLPGAIGPAVLTFALPLFASLVLTGVATTRWTRQVAA